MAIEINPREKRLLGILAVVGAILALLAIPFALELMVDSRRTENEELRQALDDVQDARGKVRERQAKKDTITQRYGKRAPALAGFIEENARKQKIEVTDSVDRPDVPVGKRYTERATNVHLKKAGMYAIAKFLESIETSGYAVAISRLDVHKRSGEPDSYDVDLGVSAYDRAPDAAPAAPASSGGAKP
jgi:general secretion pathway protein M